MIIDYEAWRCCHDEKKFCPDEGCPTTGPGGKPYGCARDHGWVPGQESPAACRGVRDDKSKSQLKRLTIQEKL